MTTQTTTQILDFVAAYAAGVRTDANGGFFNISFGELEKEDLEEHSECYNTSVCSGGRDETVYMANDSKLVVKKIYSMDDIGYRGGNFRIFAKEIFVCGITAKQKEILDRKTKVLKNKLLVKKLKEEQAAIEAKRVFFKEVKTKVIANYGQCVWSVINDKGFKVCDLLHVAELVSKAICPINSDFKDCEQWSQLPNWLPKNNLRYVTENVQLAIAIQEYNKGSVATQNARFVYNHTSKASIINSNTELKKAI